MSLRHIVIISILALWPVMLEAADKVEIPPVRSKNILGSMGYELSMIEYYKVNKEDLSTAKSRHIVVEELPILFFLAQKTGVKPLKIILLRRHSKKSWFDITRRLGLDGTAYYVEIGMVPEPPYGKQYTRFQLKPREKWAKFRLSDEEITNLVNLKLITGSINFPVRDVVRMRRMGRDFPTILDFVKKSKRGRRGPSEGPRGAPRVRKIVPPPSTP